MLRVKQAVFRWVGFSLSLSCCTPILATDLWTVYQQARRSDPGFKMALAKRLSDEEALPRAHAFLLPQINARSSFAWTQGQILDNNFPLPSTSDSSLRTSSFSLDLRQTVFNFSLWQNVKQAGYQVKAGVAEYNAAAQSLIFRTTIAFLGILEAREVLRYTEAEKLALQGEYNRVYQSFKVGLKTMTDVHTAKAAYDASIAGYVKAKNNLENAKEDLRVITGRLYTHLDWLKKAFPLVRPNPQDISRWVEVASQQNWALQAARYQTLAAKQQIKSKEGGHLPTIDVMAGYQHTRSQGAYDYEQSGPAATLNLNLPLFAGGLTQSDVRKAMADYQFAKDQETRLHRGVLNQTRKSFLGVLSDIRQVQADKQAILSNQKSLEGTQEGYQVGIRTIVDVLNAQRALYASQKTYAIDRYRYVVDILQLKQSAGILNEKDLIAINRWLGHTHVQSAKHKTKHFIKKTSVHPMQVQKQKARRINKHRLHKIASTDQTALML
jgi:outer membrane protein